MDLQALSDKIEIGELLSRYARGVDTGDWELWRSVFTEDAVLDYSSVGVPPGDPKAISAIFEQAYVGVPMIQHVITNVEVELDGDEAKVRAMFLNPYAPAGPTRLTCCGGYYTHEMVRTAEGWKSRHVVEHSQWFVNAPSGLPEGVNPALLSPGS